MRCQGLQAYIGWCGGGGVEGQAVGLVLHACSTLDFVYKYDVMLYLIRLG